MTLIMLDYLQVVKRNAISRIDPGVESKPLPALSCADCHKGGRGWSHDVECGIWRSAELMVRAMHMQELGCCLAVGFPLTSFLSDGHVSSDLVIPSALCRRSSQLDAVSHAVDAHRRAASSFCSGSSKRAPERSAREHSYLDYR